jgi:hypothetical protein
MENENCRTGRIKPWSDECVNLSWTTQNMDVNCIKVAILTKLVCNNDMYSLYFTGPGTSWVASGTIPQAETQIF